MFPRWSRHRSKSEPRQGWWMARNSVGLLTWEDAPNVLSVWVDRSQVAATTSLSSKCVPAWTGRDLAPFWRISSKSIDLHIHIINFYSTVGWRCVTDWPRMSKTVHPGVPSDIQTLLLSSVGPFFSSRSGQESSKYTRKGLASGARIYQDAERKCPQQVVIQPNIHTVYHKFHSKIK